MRLRLAAIVATLALGVLFPFKALGTILPDLFAPLPLARASASLMLAASLGMLLFFSTVRDRFEQRRWWSAAFAARVGMAGAGIGALVDLRNLLVSVDLASGTHRAATAGRLGELASAVALLWFFAAIRRRARTAVPALAGSSALVALALAVFVLDVSGLGLSWLAAWSYLPALALAPVVLAAAAGLLWFFLRFALDPSPLAG